MTRPSTSNARTAAPPHTSTTINELEYDNTEARRFLRLIDKVVPHFTLQTFDDVGPKGAKDDSLARTLHVDRITKKILALYEKGAGVFVTVNETDGTGRKSKNIVRVRAVWQEDDNGYQGEFPLEPNIIN